MLEEMNIKLDIVVTNHGKSIIWEELSISELHKLAVVFETKLNETDNIIEKRRYVQPIEMLQSS